MKLALALAIPLVTTLACGSPADLAKAAPPANQRQIISRLTDDIWPAVSDYNGAQFQKTLNALLSVTDPNAPVNDSLLATVPKLGQSGYDSRTQTTNGNDGLHPGNVHVELVNGDTATLSVCYTYIHFWYHDVEDTQRAPGASEAMVHLVDVNNTWYLRAITNDHVVPGCPSSTD